jgi:mannosyltransferase
VTVRRGIERLLQAGAERADATALLVLVGAGATLRFATIGVQSFWDNEAYTRAIVQGSLERTADLVPFTESTPPLYYLLAWAWTRLFGSSDVGLRSLSALAGTATVAVAWLAARELLGRRAALVATGLVAFNPILIWYSQEARSYALLVLLTTGSLYCFARASRRPTRWRLGAWAAVSVAAVSTHYFALFALAPEAVLLLVGVWRGAPATRRWTLAAVAGVALAGVALVPLAHQQLSNTGGTSVRPLSVRVTRVPLHFLVGPNDSSLQAGLALPMALLVALAVWILVSRSPKESRRGAATAAVLGGAGIGVPLVLALLGADFIDSRNLLPALVPLLLVVAAGIGAIRSGWLRAAAAGGLGALGLATVLYVSVTPAVQRTDYRGAARALGRPTSTRAVAVVLSGRPSPFGLGQYLPGAHPLPTAGSRVLELDVLVFSQRIGSNRSPPRLAAIPATPVSGFHQVLRRNAATYTLLRFRASRPRLVRLVPGGMPGLRGLPGFVLLQGTRVGRWDDGDDWSSQEIVGTGSLPPA